VKVVRLDGGVGIVMGQGGDGEGDGGRIGVPWIGRGVEVLSCCWRDDIERLVTEDRPLARSRVKARVTTDRRRGAGDESGEGDGGDVETLEKLATLRVQPNIGISMERRKAPRGPDP
jgi:hypothetical protein